MKYEIELDIFQGPLELLYQLIKKNKIKISKVSLKEITDQYLSYIRQLKKFDLDIASDFMLIAAELIELKTEQLLPGKEKEKENKSKKNLVDRLKIYEKYKKAAQALKKRGRESAKLYYRQRDITEKFAKSYRLEIDKDINDLAVIYKKALKSFNSHSDNLTSDKENIDIDYIKEDSIDVREKIDEILNYVDKYPAGVEFKKLIKDNNNYMEVVVTLLSLLELIQMRKLKVKQSKLFANIKVYTVSEKVFS